MIGDDDIDIFLNEDEFATQCSLSSGFRFPGIFTSEGVDPFAMAQVEGRNYRLLTANEYIRQGNIIQKVKININGEPYRVEKITPYGPDKKYSMIGLRHE